MGTVWFNEIVSMYVNGFVSAKPAASSWFSRNVGLKASYTVVHIIAEEQLSPPQSRSCSYKLNETVWFMLCKVKYILRYTEYVRPIDECICY